MSLPIGPDYASVDGNTKPDFAKAKGAGARFVIPRAVYGRPVTAGSKRVFLDPVWQRDSFAIKSIGLKRSAYLFVCYPRRGLYTPPPEEQAEALCSYVTLDKNIDFVPAFDVEESSDVLSPAEMYDWTLCVAECLFKHYGAWPLMYTSARVWHEYFADHKPGALSNCPLWLAKPWPWAVRTSAHLDGAPSYSPSFVSAFGNQSFVYQYQGDGLDFPGFNKTVDVNRFQTTKRGATGEQVKWIQKRLGVTTDGDFGPMTESAVKSLQTSHGLTADGIVGVDTFAVLCWMC